MEPPDVGTVSWYPQMSRYPQIFQPLVSPLENRENFRIRYPQIFRGGSSPATENQIKTPLSMPIRKIKPSFPQIL